MFVVENLKKRRDSSGKPTRGERAGGPACSLFGSTRKTYDPERPSAVLRLSAACDRELFTVAVAQKSSVDSPAIDLELVAGMGHRGLSPRVFMALALPSWLIRPMARSVRNRAKF